MYSPYITKGHSSKVYFQLIEMKLFLPILTAFAYTGKSRCERVTKKNPLDYDSFMNGDLAQLTNMLERPQA